MELNNLQHIESESKFGRNEMFHIGTGLLLIVATMLYALTVSIDGGPFSIERVVDAMISGYITMNIGTNDVANNLAPSVGSSALTVYSLWH